MVDIYQGFSVNITSIGLLQYFSQYHYNNLFSYILWSNSKAGSNTDNKVVQEKHNDALIEIDIHDLRSNRFYVSCINQVLVGYFIPV